MIRKSILMIVLIWGSNLSFSQNRIILKVVSEKLTKEQKKVFDYKTDHSDSLSAVMELKKLVLRFREQSFLLASVDTIYKKRDTVFAHLDIGQRWKWSTLKQGNVYDYILNKSGYREKFYTNTS